MQIIIDRLNGIIRSALRAYLAAEGVCLSEIKLAHTDDEVRQEMA
jgi:hypothetical protein